LRAFLRLLRGNLSQGADKVGTLHTMRFVFFDNDTRLLFKLVRDMDLTRAIPELVLDQGVSGASSQEVEISEHGTSPVTDRLCDQSISVGVN
jgi:hypothetical protein